MVAWHTRNVPVRLTAMMRSQSSFRTSVVCAKLPMPAMLQATSSFPKSATTPATALVTESTSATLHP